MSQPQYVPGVCNIGPAEIHARKRVGWTGVVLTVAIWIVLLLLHSPKSLFLVLFFPATVAATGFIQAYSHFCAAFGMQGLFNVISEVGKTDTVMQAESRKQDRNKAIRIIVYSVLVGIVIALLAYFVC
jgi:hypothetical protein